MPFKGFFPQTSFRYWTAPEKVMFTTFSPFVIFISLCSPFIVRKQLKNLELFILNYFEKFCA